MLTMEPETVNTSKEEVATTAAEAPSVPVKSHKAPSMPTEAETGVKAPISPTATPTLSKEPSIVPQPSQHTNIPSVPVKDEPPLASEKPSESQVPHQEAEQELHPDPAAGVEPKVSPALSKEQLKYCATVLKGLKRHPQSPPFQQPVDPVALNIPDYFTVIKEPMDLSTVTKKLEGGEYKDADAFIADVRLMLNNCFTYNHPDSQVAKMGRSLEKYFSTSIGKMPTTLPTAGEENSSAAARRKSEPILSAQRARRESHAPSRLAGVPVAGGGTPRGRARSSANPELAFCGNVLRELLKKSSQNVSWPFLEPVDPVKLGIPDYFDVIKTPMDLSTVRRKLETSQYTSAEQFEADVRLIISNCLTYNAPDSDVVTLCRGFERLFESKWSQKPTSFATAAQTSASIHHQHYDDDSDSEKILEINRQIQALQQELNTLLMKRKQHKVSAPRAPKKKPPTASSGTVAPPAAPPKPVVITEEEFLSRPMSFEEKRQLSIEVNNLPPERLGRVVEIIQAGMALEAQGDSDVIELDIESLNVRTLRQLQKYVMECKGITSLAAMLGETGATQAPAKRKKSAAAGGPPKKAAATIGATAGGPTSAVAAPAPASATAAAAAVMSSDEESSDEDLD